MLYVDQLSVSREKRQKCHYQAGESPATVAQQCAECVHSYKGMLPEELTLESIRRRAAEGRLPCMVGMNPPAAGTCPMFRPLAPDGDMLDLVGADEDDGVSVDEHGTVTIEVR